MKNRKNVEKGLYIQASLTIPSTYQFICIVTQPKTTFIGYFKAFSNDVMTSLRGTFRI